MVVGDKENKCSALDVRGKGDCALLAQFPALLGTGVYICPKNMNSSHRAIFFHLSSSHKKCKKKSVLLHPLPVTKLPIELSASHQIILMCSRTVLG